MSEIRGPSFPKKPDNQIGIEVKKDVFSVVLAGKCASVVYFSL